MKGRALVLVSGALIWACGCNRADSRAAQGIPLPEVADYIHTVIAADRAIYAEQVVHRLQDVEKVIKADEKFKAEKALPFPAQMLRMGAQEAGKSGKFRYALISKWAINKANQPKTEFEKNGFDALLKDSEKPHTGYETLGGKKFFMALYADKAVSEACIRCHNSHPESPRQDFKLGEVMGGIVISFPVSP